MYPSSSHLQYQGYRLQIPPSIFIRIALAKFGVIGLGTGAGDTFPISAVPSRTTLGTGVYAIEDDFEEAGYTNPLPIADDDEPDGDPQEVCRSGKGCRVRLRGAGLQLIFVAGEDGGATDDILF